MAMSFSRALPFSLLLLLLVVVLVGVCSAAEPQVSPQVEARVSSFFGGESGGFSGHQRHTNNWAVLVCSSRFWFNYRHVSNVLGLYRSVKRLGIPDSQILLLLSDDMSCNPRNSYMGQIFNNENHKLDLYGSSIEVDYRDYEVSVENFIRILTGRHHPETPRSKRLLSDDRSNVLIYMTGHGGDEFLKFQDVEEISSHDLADSFEQMREKRRYKELLFIIDTCQANTLYKQFYSENILAIGSSKLGENSYSHHSDPQLGLAVIDRFTYYTLEFFESRQVQPDSKATMIELFSSYDIKKVSSHPEWRTDLFQRPLDQTPLTDFFGSVFHMELTDEYPTQGVPVQESKESAQSASTEVKKIRGSRAVPKVVQPVQGTLFHPTFLFSVGVVVFAVVASSISPFKSL